jgi:hypothetical protein
LRLRARTEDQVDDYLGSGTKTNQIPAIAQDLLGG